MSGINPKQPITIKDLRTRLETLEAEYDGIVARTVKLRDEIKGVHAQSTPIVWRVLDPMLDRLNRICPEQKQDAS